jgi:hypothetical protein
MTRTMKTLATLFLGSLLFTSVACENKETEEALKTCRNDLGNEQKRGAGLQSTLNDVKSQLAAAQTKVAELSKAAEAPKNGKPEERAKGAESKKPEQAAKGEKMEKREKKK